jgi:hypothetical protein
VTGECNSQDVAAMSAIYQADRADNTAVLNVNLALIGAELAYLAAALAFSDKLSQLPVAIASFIAAPLWMGLAINAVLVGLGAKRANSILEVEDKLYTLAGLDPRRRAEIGAKSTEPVMNVGYPSAYSGSLILGYAGPVLLVALYTVYLLVNNVRPHSVRTFEIALVCYVMALLLNAAVWLKNFDTKPNVNA